MGIRRRWAIGGGVALAALLGIVGVGLSVAARALSGLAAKATCTCVFVSQRSEAVCTEDELEAQGIGFVSTKVDQGASAVQASVFFLSPARATFREETGCTLE